MCKWLSGIFTEKVEKIYDKDFKKNNKPKPDTEMKNPKPPQPWRV